MALVTDWSRTGMGFMLLQKHFNCTKIIPAILSTLSVRRSNRANKGKTLRYNYYVTNGDSVQSMEATATRKPRMNTFIDLVVRT